MEELTERDADNLGRMMSHFCALSPDGVQRALAIFRILIEQYDKSLIERIEEALQPPPVSQDTPAE